LARRCDTTEPGKRPLDDPALGQDDAGQPQALAVHRDVALASCALFSRVISSVTRFQGGLGRLRVDDRCAGLRRAAQLQAKIIA